MLVADNLPVVPLNLQQALQYLRKENMRVTANVSGWALIAYEGLNLGWAKFLSNRMNNYYPKELRILKDITGFQTKVAI